MLCHSLGGCFLSWALSVTVYSELLHHGCTQCVHKPFVYSDSEIFTWALCGVFFWASSASVHTKVLPVRCCHGAAGCIRQPQHIYQLHYSLMPHVCLPISLNYCASIVSLQQVTNPVNLTSLLRYVTIGMLIIIKLFYFCSPCIVVKVWRLCSYLRRSWYAM